jgi:hypothetical protein
MNKLSKVDGFLRGNGGFRFIMCFGILWAVLFVVTKL